VTSIRIRNGKGDTQFGLSSRFLHFFLTIVIPLLLHSQNCPVLLKLVFCLGFKGPNLGMISFSRDEEIKHGTSNILADLPPHSKQKSMIRTLLI